jgi:hypothetical protein
MTSTVQIETPVARKRRTSANVVSTPIGTARSSTNLRKEAGGQRSIATHLSGAAGKNSKARKGRTAAKDGAIPSCHPPQSTKSNSKVGQSARDAYPTIADLASPISALQFTNVHHPDSERAPHTGGHPLNVAHDHLAAGFHTYPMPAEQRDAVASINDAWRKRQGIVRAMTRLSLQAQATLRSGRDREEAAKHYAVVAKDMTHADYPNIAPYLEAKEPLATYREAYEKSLVQLVKRLPIYAWAKGVSGLGDVSLAGLIGECSGCNLETDEHWSIGQMKSVSAFWKRMGVGVVGGIRQQRVKGDAAIEHGYVAERRSVLWNIGECIIKAQWRKENTVHAYGKLYGEIKANMQARNEAGEFSDTALEIAARMKKAGSKPLAENVAGRLTPSHINNRAKRHVTKRLLRDLFVEWRRLDAEARDGLNTAPKLA